MKGYQQIRNSNWYRSSSVPCKICGEANGWCVVHQSGKIVGCMKVPNESGEKTFGGAYKYLVNGNEISKSKYVKQVTEPKQDADVLDEVYRLVLEKFPLTPEHKKKLIEMRGFSEEELAIYPFGSFSKQVKQGIIELDGDKPQFVAYWKQWFSEKSISIDSWKGVAGFFNAVADLNSNEELPVFETKEGILLPVYDEVGRIVGLQVENDARDEVSFQGEVKRKFEKSSANYFVKAKKNEKGGYELSIHHFEKGFQTTIQTDQKHLNSEIDGWKMNGYLKEEPKYLWVSSSNKRNGCSSGSPATVLWKDEQKTFWITEGILKGTILHAQLQRHNIDVGVLSIAGVNQWRKIVSIVKEMKIKSVYLAFDNDWKTNEQVKESYQSLTKELSKIDHLAIRIVEWSGTKGIDDCFLETDEVPKLSFVTVK